MNKLINEENEKRISIAKRLGKPDKVPLILWDQADFLTGWLGIDNREFLNPEVMLEAQIKFRRRFKGIGIIGPNYGVAIAPSALGAKVIFPKYPPPEVKPIINDLGELEDYLVHFKEPDPLFSGYIPLLCATYFYMREKVGKILSGSVVSDPFAAPISILGPWETSALLIGVQNILIGTKICPDLIHKLMEKVTTFLLHSMEARARLFRIEPNEIFLADDTCANLSPEAFREFVVPYFRRIYQQFGPSDSVNVWHCDGNLSHLMELLPEMGVTVLTNFDPYTDISEFKRRIGGKVCLIGNIAPIQIVRNGTPEEVKKEAKRQIEIAGQNGGYILTTGGELANGTPPQNIDALIEAIEEQSIG